MKRILAVAAMMVVVFVAVLALSRGAILAGLVPDNAVSLWANAMTAGAGQMAVGQIVSAYPTLPFFATSLLEFISPVGTPTPVLVTAGVLALLAGSMFSAFRRLRLPVIGGPLMVLLIVLHPAVLRAAIEGPADVIFAAFLFLLGGALFDLRVRCAAAEVMAVSLSLAGLAFSHPMGAAFACASVPLLVFAVRPELLSSWVLNLVMALIFPTVFCAISYFYTSWLFLGSGWTFLVTPAEGLAAWAAGFSQFYGRNFSHTLPFLAGGIMMIATVLSAPLIPIAIYWAWSRRPLLSPALVMTATTFVAVCLAVFTKFFGDPTVLMVMPPMLAAIMIIHMPPVRERLAIVLPLLLLGWVGGFVGLALFDPRSATDTLQALEGHRTDPVRAAAIGLGDATVGHDGVMVDTVNAPAIVLGRGYARGLLSPSNEAFSFNILFAHLDAPFVAVPDPQVGNGAQDRLNKAFPLLYQRGADGYRLIYDHANWRLFARE